MWALCSHHQRADLCQTTLYKWGGQQQGDWRPECCSQNLEMAGRQWICQTTNIISVYLYFLNHWFYFYSRNRLLREYTDSHLLLVYFNPFRSLFSWTLMVRVSSPTSVEVLSLTLTTSWLLLTASSGQINHEPLAPPTTLLMQHWWFSEYTKRSLFVTCLCLDVMLVCPHQFKPSSVPSGGRWVWPGKGWRQWAVHSCGKDHCPSWLDRWPWDWV